MSGRPYAEVIGDPIAHSKSPLIHNFWLGKLGIDAEYRACQVRADELADYFAQRRKDAKWRGCNVTMPHKQAVLDYADETTGDINEAANVIFKHREKVFFRHREKLVAANTDLIGLLEPLAKYPLPVEWIEYNPIGPGRCAICQIIGAGGAALSAIDAAFETQYLHIEIYNRSPEVARQRLALSYVSARQIFGLEDLRLGPMRPGHPLDGYEPRFLIINASPMGMAGQPEVPIDLSRYPPETIVFDMVYAPVETSLLRQARGLGFRTIDGLEMLVAQAAASFKIFFGQPAPREHDAELRALLTA